MADEEIIEIPVDRDEQEDFAKAVTAFKTADTAHKEAADNLDAAAAALALYFPAVGERYFDTKMRATAQAWGQTFTATCVRPVVTEVDQEALAKVVTDAATQGVDIRRVVGIEYKLNQRNMREAKPEIAAQIAKCITRSPYKKDGDLRKPKLEVR